MFHVSNQHYQNQQTNSQEAKPPWTRGQEILVSNLKTHLTFLSTTVYELVLAITKSIQRNCCNLLYIENRDRFDSIIPRQSCTGLSEPGVQGLPRHPPDFGRSVNPISTRKDRLCPPHYYCHPRIFRPSYGPDQDYSCGLCAKYGFILCSGWKTSKSDLVKCLFTYHFYKMNLPATYFHDFPIAEF